MAYDFRMLVTLFKRSLTATRGTDARLTPKRIVVVTLILAYYPFYAIIHGTFLLLDDLLLFFYRKVKVISPVFIVGVPRSGTTFLHRLVAKDTERFTCIKTWELLFAPSIIQKCFFLALGKIDKLIGSPFYRLLVFVQKKILPEKTQQIHRLGLFQPEEDDPLFSLVLSSVFLSFMFPFADVFRPLVHFDDEVPEKQRAKLMKFYKKCVQRHLFVFGRNKQFLSKNPTFSPKVESLRQTFPDCRVVCTTRNPYEVVPSVFSLFYTVYPAFFSPVGRFPMRDFLVDLISHWLRYPPEKLRAWPKKNQDVIRYDDLVAHPDKVVLKLYRRFGLIASDRYKEVLDAETAKARKYKSNHSYSLDEFGFDEKEVYAMFKDVFTEYGFNRSRKAS